MSISAILASIAALLAGIAASVGAPPIDTTAYTRATSTVPATVSTTTTATPSRGTAAPKPGPTANDIAPAIPPVQIAPPPTFKAEGETPKLAAVLPKVRSATVNIICTPTQRGLRGISGSGIIMDSRGLILTAAHVAQFMLFQDSKFNCVVRTGSPATKAYTAEIVYISPSWIRENSTVMTATNPVGTGEHDFAVLAITGSATELPLPKTFVSVPLSSDDPEDAEPVVIGSYGAEFLDSQRIRTALFPTIVYSSVKKRYTFQSTSIDILSLGGGAAAQEGSSGGSAVNEEGLVIGTITTSSTGPDIAARDLHAITMNHIRRSFRVDMARNFDSYFADTSIAELRTGFADQNANLKGILTRANSF